MAWTLNTTVVSPDGLVSLRFQDESGAFMRRCICPGESYASEPASVIAVCAAAHTPAVIVAYRAAYPGSI